MRWSLRAAFSLARREGALSACRRASSTSAATSLSCSSGRARSSSPRRSRSIEVRAVRVRRVRFTAASVRVADLEESFQDRQPFRAETAAHHLSILEFFAFLCRFRLDRALIVGCALADPWTLARQSLTRRGVRSGVLPYLVKLSRILLTRYRGVYLGSVPVNMAPPIEAFLQDALVLVIEVVTGFIEPKPTWRGVVLQSIGPAQPWTCGEEFIDMLCGEACAREWSHPAETSTLVFPFRSSPRDRRRNLAPDEHGIRSQVVRRGPSCAQCRHCAQRGPAAATARVAGSCG